MNIIKLIFTAITEWIARNPLTCIVLLVLMAVAPWFFGVVALAVAAVVLVAAVSLVPLVWRIRRLQREMEDSAGMFGSRQRRREHREGDVTVVADARTSKRVRDDVGEYVDFREIDTPPAEEERE